LFEKKNILFYDFMIFIFFYENGGFQKRSPKWGRLKTEVYRFGVDSKNGAFRKR